MKKILLINACVRKESRTRRLAEEVLKKLTASEPEGTVQIRECILHQEKLQPLDEKTLLLRDRLILAGDFSHDMFRYARELAAADVIVIAAPFWDMSFPASLKLYVEATMVTDLVFRYNEQGMPESLCRASEMIYVCTAGGPVFPPHHGYEYMKMISEYFWGIPHNSLILAENLDVAGNDPELILQEKLREIRES
jgi:FMN-dependent NADH-azoreductase